MIVIDAYHFGCRAPRGIGGLPESYEPAELGQNYLADMNSECNYRWTVKTALEKDRWHAALRIPFASLGKENKGALHFLFDLWRISGGGSFVWNKGVAGNLILKITKSEGLKSLP